MHIELVDHNDKWEDTRVADKFCPEIYFDRFGKTNYIKTIFDVGANKGNTAIGFTNAFPQAKIYAFEPVQETFNVLKDCTKNISNIEPHHIGFGDSTGMFEIYLDDSFASVLNSLSPHINKQDTKASKRVEWVQIDTIDSFCEQRRIEHINILKSDTEGYDLNVLKGAKKLLSNGCIDFVICEVSLQAENKQNTNLFPVNEFMESNNFLLCGLYDIYYKPPYNYLYFCDAVFVNKNFRPYPHYHKMDMEVTIPFSNLSTVEQFSN